MTILDDRQLQPQLQPQLQTSGGRTPPPPRRPTANLDDFADDIHAALSAFGADANYAVTMARAAVTIERKRSAGQNRRKDKH